MNKILPLLIFLVLFSISIFPSLTVNAGGYIKYLTFTIHGPAEVFLVYPNGTKVPIGNGTYQFEGYMGVYVTVPQGYDLYINGTKIYPYYMRYFNSSATFIIYAIPVYYTLTINLTGNGTAMLHFLNDTEEELTSSTSFKVLNTTYVWITSTTPFMIDRDTMVTHYFGEKIIANTTWNVIFNPQTPQGYVKISVTTVNQGTVNMTVYNTTTYLTLVEINSSESFLVPKGYQIAFYSYTNNFTVDNQHSIYIFKGGYNYYYYGTAKYNSSIIIVFFNTTKSTTTTRTVTSTNSSTIVSSTSTPTLSSSSQSQTKPPSANNPLLPYAIIGAVLVVFGAYIAIKEFRKES